MANITLTITATGDHTEDELKEFVLFQLGLVSIYKYNSFIIEDSDSDIIDVVFKNN